MDTYRALKVNKPPRAKQSCAFDVVEWARVRLGFQADERQAEVLRSGAKWGILNCTRQWGKSTLGAAKVVHHACANAGSLVLVASPSGRQSGELMHKAAAMLARLGIRKRGAPGATDISLMLPNGSRIVGLPGIEATARGFSAVSLLVIDEAARVEDAAYKTLRPMLATVNGGVWLLSTPFGKRGFFWEEWAHGGEDWFRMSVPATECTRISREWLEKERRSMGPTWFQQEYMCAFLDNGAAVFGRDLVEAAFDEGVEELRLG
ncbi:MAG TPA: terminase family protein [Bryobacteraceae bacterium]|nr:terminase family protein [Bryobacteraceae bacterium]